MNFNIIIIITSRVRKSNKGSAWVEGAEGKRRERDKKGTPIKKYKKGG